MYESTSLAAAHDVTAFNSGQPALDSWLRHSASLAAAKRIAQSFVWLEGETVVAYYSLSAHLISRDEFPPGAGRGEPNRIPAVLLGRLALDRSLQGKGLGPRLLMDAFRHMLIAAKYVGMRYCIVEAIDHTAAGFYHAHGFRPMRETHRLAMKMSTGARQFPED